MKKEHTYRILDLSMNIDLLGHAGWRKIQNIPKMVVKNSNLPDLRS